MLLKFAVTNYRGFAHTIEWDLTKHANYDFNTAAISEDGIVKKGIIYGTNGSGKSNFSLAIFDVVTLLSPQVRKPNYHKNFIYAGGKDKLVDFEYTFRFADSIINYQYSKDENEILHKECLKVNDAMIFEKNYADLFIDRAKFPISDAAINDLKVADNNVSIANYILATLPLAENHYLLKLQRFVNSMLWFRSVLEGNDYIGFENTPTNIEEFIIKNDLLDDFKRFLHDISGQDFTFAQPKIDDKVIYCVYNNNLVLFDSIISTGTKALRLLYYWLRKINRASFVIIDEFDAFYHYQLSFNICKELFRLPCQLFLTSHNTRLMNNDLLRPDCNFILQSNEIKSVEQLTQKELRFAHNIENLYRGKAFGV